MPSHYETLKHSSTIGRWRFHVACVLIAIALPSAAGAIIMRDDVDESKYLLLGERYRPVLVALAIPAQSDHAPMLYSGMGTLIAPDWVITAAHAAARIKRGHPLSMVKGEQFVFVKGRGYRVAEVFIHPQWTGDKDSAHDVALIRLEHDVNHAAPAGLYEQSDERDQIVTVAGTGLPGNGRAGPGDGDGALRAGTVRVDTADGGLLTWKFRAPDDPRTTPLEGISGPGDSGGPALIDVAGKPCVAGISSTQRIEIENPQPGVDPESLEGHYGVTEVYSRVSQFVPWIRSTMAAHAARAKSKPAH